ncbi:hypothetical protein QE400_000113 [Xanthomonas sacchari]|nr:hypothetical protein [Xanthomonas sacchari]
MPRNLDIRRPPATTTSRWPDRSVSRMPWREAHRPSACQWPGRPSPGLVLPYQPHHTSRGCGGSQGRSSAQCQPLRVALPTRRPVAAPSRRGPQLGRSRSRAHSTTSGLLTPSLYERSHLGSVLRVDSIGVPLNLLVADLHPSRVLVVRLIRKKRQLSRDLVLLPRDNRGHARRRWIYWRILRNRLPDTTLRRTSLPGHRPLLRRVHAQPVHYLSVGGGQYTTDQDRAYDGAHSSVTHHAPPRKQHPSTWPRRTYF